MIKRTPVRSAQRARSIVKPKPETVFQAFVRTLERLDPTSAAPAHSKKTGPSGAGPGEAP